MTKKKVENKEIEPAEVEATEESIEGPSIEPVEEQQPDVVPEPEPVPEVEQPEAEIVAPEPKLIWDRRCINCGQNERPIEATEGGYHCRSCGHDWTDEHEQAPFRRG